jgi:uncharacterized membrane protein
MNQYVKAMVVWLGSFFFAMYIMMSVSEIVGGVLMMAWLVMLCYGIFKGGGGSDGSNGGSDGASW